MDMEAWKLVWWVENTNPTHMHSELQGTKKDCMRNLETLDALEEKISVSQVSLNAVLDWNAGKLIQCYHLVDVNPEKTETGTKDT